MAKRDNKEPFHPVNASLASSVLSNNTEPKPEAKPEKKAEKQTVKRDRAKRVLFTKDEERELERLVREIGEELDVNLQLSNVLRACTVLLQRGKRQILASANAAETLKRPPNDAEKLSEFEQAIARVLLDGFKQCPPFEE